MRLEWRPIKVSTETLAHWARKARCKLTRRHRWSGWHRDIHTQEQVRACFRCGKADWR